MKKILKIIICILILVSLVWLWEIPIQKSIAVNKFYMYMEEIEGVNKDDIILIDTARDYKSSVSSTKIFFILKKTNREFLYFYSLKEGFWSRNVIGPTDMWLRSDKSIFEE